MPPQGVAEAQPQERERSFIDRRRFTVCLANAAEIVRAFLTQHITAIAEHNSGIAALQSSYDRTHMADKFFAVAFALKKLYTQCVVRAQINLTQRAITFDRRFERIIASAIFTPSGIRNGATHSMSDSPRFMPVTTINQTVPII